MAGRAPKGSGDEACHPTASLDYCLAELQKGTEEPGLGMALSALRTQHMKETGGVARFRDRGGLAPLLGVLAGAPRSNRTLELALGVLENCCAEEDSRTQVRELGGIPPLVTILKSLPAESIQNRTARALGSLAIDSENCKGIHEAGAVPQLIQVLTTSQDSECLQSVIRAIRYLANSPAHRLLLAQQGAVRPIAERLTSSRDDAALLTAAVRALVELTKGCSRDCAEQLSLGEGVAPLVALAGLEKRAVQESALAVVANLCLQGVLRPAIGNAGGVDLLVREIQLRRGSGTPGVSLHPLVRALCLLCQEVTNQSRVRESGGLELLLSLLRDRGHSSSHACVVVAFVAFFYDEEGLEMLQAGGLIPLLVGRLAAQGQRAGQEEEEEEEEEDCDDEEGAAYSHFPTEKRQGEWVLTKGGLPLWRSFDTPRYYRNPWWFVEFSPFYCESEWFPESPQWSSDTSVSEWESEGYVSSGDDRYESLGHGSTTSGTKSHSRAESPDLFHSPILDLPLVDHPNVSEALNSTVVDAAPPDQDFCPSLLAEFEDLHLGPVQEDPKSNGKESQAAVGTQEQQELEGSELASPEEEPSGKDLPCSSASGAASKPVTIKEGKGDAKAEESAWIALATSQNSAGPSNSDSPPMILVPSKDDQSQLSPRPTSRSPDPEEGSSVPQKLSVQTLPGSAGEGRKPPSCWKQPAKFRYTFEQIKTPQPLLNIGGASPLLLNLDSPFFVSPDENERELRAPEAPALLLLSRFSQVQDPHRTLVTPTVLQGLLRYITGSPSPSSRCFRLLHRLTCNPTCLEAFVRCYGPSLIRTWLVLGISPEEAAAIVAGEQEEEGPLLDAEEWDGGRLREVGETLLMNFCHQALSLFDIWYILQSGSESDQVAWTLASPFMFRKESICRKLLLDLSGLRHLLGALLQDPEPSFIFYVSDALSILLSSLAQNPAPTPPPAPKWPGLDSPTLCMYSLLVDEETAEMFFCLDSGHTFPALREMVSSASEVFCAMLAGGFAESSQTTVTIHDVLPEPFMALIHFLHGCPGNSCPFLDASFPLALAEDILMVAEQYLLPELQALVEDSLIQNFLRPGTLGEVVCLAERQNRPHLLGNCAAYVFLWEGFSLAQRAATLAKLLRVAADPSSFVTGLLHRVEIMCLPAD